MVIFLQEDHELPLIDELLVFAAEFNVLPNKTGLMDIYGEVWRTGGTKTGRPAISLTTFSTAARPGEGRTGGAEDSTSIGAGPC